MMLTIQEEGMRFGVRVGAIIYNQDRSKILQVEELMFMRIVRKR